ncbi:unnamed protein product [Amoebophrya sp. A25]|nr:unnamed protein product [Amoebophrya sp. A25]|eukprot:GSA25T00016961001.1
MHVSDVVIPARFSCTIAQLVFVLALLQDRKPYLLQSLPKNYTQDQYDTFDSEFTGALGFATACGILETLSVVMVGSTLLLNKACFVQFCFHFCGAIATFAFGMANSHFDYFWEILVLFTLLPALLEVASLFYLHITQVHGPYF